MPTQPFDPVAYWQANGPALSPPDSDSPEQAAVRKLMTSLLDEFRETIHTVIDVGCGQGRLAAWLKQELPEAIYTGVDLGESQLLGTGKVRPDGSFYLSRLQDFKPGLQWDLVLCSEVLLHIPPSEIQQAVDNLLAITGKYLITVDWTRPLGQGISIAPWNWLHDYDSLLHPDVEIQSDNQSIFLKRVLSVEVF